VAEPQDNGYRRPSTDAAASRSDIHHMRRRGAKSFVDDLVLSRGVVLSRAELFCDRLRLSPMTRRFVRYRRTYLLLSIFDDVNCGGHASWDSRTDSRARSRGHRTQPYTLSSLRIGATAVFARRLLLLCPVVVNDGGQSSVAALHCGRRTCSLWRRSYNAVQLCARITADTRIGRTGRPAHSVECGVIRAR
jgi:hypothetical protein